MSKGFISFLIFGIFIGTIIYPYAATTILHTMDAKDDVFLLHYGFLHIPSLVFIVLSAIILHLSVKSKSDKVVSSHKKAKKDLYEAIDILSKNDKTISTFSESENVFCKDIKDIILNSGIEEDIELVIGKHISSLTSSYERLINEYGYIATVLPMLGMIGTVTGLLQMFAIDGGVDNFADKLASLSVALATTLYATLWVVFFTKPKSREVENWLIDIDNNEYQLIVSAKLFLHNVDISTIDIFDSTIESTDDKKKAL